MTATEAMLSAATQADTIVALATAPAQQSLWFAARQSALYASNDGGQHWRNCYEQFGLVADIPTTSLVVSPDFASDQLVLAGVNGGVLRSFDAGHHWQSITIAEPAPLVTTLVISPDFACDGVVFAGSLEDGVFRSDDRGQHWAAWNFGLLDLNVLALAISPNFTNDETLLCATGSGWFRSTNGGRAWREITLPCGNTPIISVACSASGWYAGSENGELFHSHDCGHNWQRLGTAEVHGPINAIISSTILAVLHDDTVSFSSDYGATWLALHSSDQPITALAANNDELFIGGEHVQAIPIHQIQPK